MIAIKPISVNDCFQGRRFKTKEFKEWQKSVIDELWLTARLTRAEVPAKWEKIELHLRFYLKYPLLSDTDNYEKPLIDCLKQSGWIKDDRYIFKIIAEKFQSKKEGFDFILKEYKK